VLLGKPRSELSAAAGRQPVSTRAALVLLALLCAAGALVAGVLVPLLAELAPGDLRLPTGLGLPLASTGGLPLLGIALALAAVVLLMRLLSRGPRAAAAPAWACGQRVEPALAWTSAGFTKPLRLVLETAFRPHREIVVRSDRGVVQEIAYRAEIPHLFDTWLYGPVHRTALRSAAVARRLQSGSLRAYLGYLLSLLVTLLTLARLGWLG
jgi:hydrogenase-4 component B